MAADIGPVRALTLAVAADGRLNVVLRMRAGRTLWVPVCDDNGNALHI
jgi:hypothetical protein